MATAGKAIGIDLGTTYSYALSLSLLIYLLTCASDVSVSGKTIVLRSLLTTRVTEPPHPMSRSQTLNVSLAMPQKIRLP